MTPDRDPPQKPAASNMHSPSTRNPDVGAPHEPTPAERRRLMLLIESRLNAAQTGDARQFRREIAALTQRTEELLSGERAPDPAHRRNAFERIRDAFGAIHEEFALGGLLIAFTLSTILGVFGPFLAIFLLVGLLR